MGSLGILCMWVLLGLCTSSEVYRAPLSTVALASSWLNIHCLIFEKYTFEYEIFLRASKEAETD